MTTRVPPSKKPLAPATVARIRRPANVEKAKPVKTNPHVPTVSEDAIISAPETQAWNGADHAFGLNRSHEALAEQLHSEQSAKEEVGEHHEAQEHGEGGEKEPGLRGLWARSVSNKGDARGGQGKDQQGQHQQGTGTGKHAAFKPGGNTENANGKPPSTKPGQTEAAHRSTAVRAAATSQVNTAQRMAAVAQVQNKLAGELKSFQPPPDAFALLKDAKEKGILFVEDALKDGHSEEQEDPEHRAAVEECIRLCFGIRGILRIGAGHNDRQEPIIVVATSNGFSETSLSSIPEKVHRFPTLIAIPFDLLPLKKER